MEVARGMKSVLLSSSEGGTIFGGAGMRGEVLMGALAFLNKAWDAEPQSMTRKQALSTYLDHYRVSCLISSQQETVREWFNKIQVCRRVWVFSEDFLSASRNQQ